MLKKVPRLSNGTVELPTEAHINLIHDNVASLLSYLCNRVREGEINRLIDRYRVRHAQMSKPGAAFVTSCECDTLYKMQMPFHSDPEAHRHLSHAPNHLVFYAIILSKLPQPFTAALDGRDSRTSPFRFMESKIHERYSEIAELVRAHLGDLNKTRILKSKATDALCFQCFFAKIRTAECLVHS